MKNQDFGILFLHHQVDDVVRNNLESIRRHNSDATVVTMSAGEALPDGYKLSATPEIQALHAVNCRRSSDWLVCSWYQQRKETCKKWWIVEWDTFCTVSAREYYCPVWDYPFVATNVRLRHREHAWWWFGELDKLPDEFRKYAMGASPFIFLIDDSVLTLICSTLLSKPFTTGNGELRLATIANKCGFPPCGFSPPNDQITILEWETLAQVKAIFHPVKHLVQMSGFDNATPSACLTNSKHTAADGIPLS